MLGPARRLTVICFAAVAVTVGFEQLCAQSGARRSESSVIRLEGGDDCSRTNDRELTVEVGDSTSAQFEPSFELTGWDGQVAFRVNLATAHQPLSSATRQLIVRNGQPMTRLTGDICNHELYVRADGNFEWHLILKEYPGDSVFRYSIQLHGLTVFYQDTLSTEAIANGAGRPDSVIGSYAVYHATGRGNVRHGHGYISSYGCGKAFHIYRPRICDSNNWCGLVT